MSDLIFKHLAQVLVALALVSASLSSPASTQALEPSPIEKKLAALEAATGGRIGVAAINTANNTRIQYRADESFPLQSTFKLLGVATALKLSMTDSHLFEQKITYEKEDLAYGSPVTAKHLADGMTIAELCAAAISYSDSTAMHLLMKKLGGPEAVTAYAHSIDNTNFNFTEGMSANSTPAAMQKSLQRLVLGDALAAPQREQLQTWLENNTTGNLRIRAGVPKGWRVADKTGTGRDGTTNDLAVIWPSHCSPLVVAIYFTQNKKQAVPRPRVLASTTRLLIHEFAQTDQCLKKIST